MSWAVTLEGLALNQATNLSNLPFAIDHARSRSMSRSASQRS